ncbi:hypothetical protein [Serratia sp. UGAL515B_01]|uniref:hypothetical protein n=1 Tax=Serratia sp. UGAL515B_01 TaxID=2986763 RepID=UPI002952FBEB|nr:hypothetical protein [Serratia sp. UGAL515B_01]WON78257.1 hypothetical protein OK023_06230 [Serratia sp. UGAL515B_01]
MNITACYLDENQLECEFTAALLWITPVTDEALWETLCEASQHRPDLGADWVQENGEVIIGGDWLTESGITAAEQLEVTAAPGVLRLQRRELDVFRA